MPWIYITAKPARVKGGERLRDDSKSICWFASVASARSPLTWHEDIVSTARRWCARWARSST
jgi:hypothetical protein